MLFNSYEFLLGFLPLMLAVFFLLARWSTRAAAWSLAIGSLVFYGWWDARYIALLASSIVFNFMAGRVIDAHRDRQASWPVTLAVVANLSLLGVFKYADFFIGSANAVGAKLDLLHLVLPMGISFFTFTQIAFLVDVHRGLVKEKNFSHYLLFVTWFPHQIAGPVLHHKQMMPQFASPQTYRINAEAISVGLTLLTIGLIKKVIFADSLSVHASPVFDAAAQGRALTVEAAWTGALAYTFQLYFDFSGYSDMAIGLSRMFNVRLPLNFDSPYKSANIIDFWRRWHMTLSQFLRDYLYVPLGGNRHGEPRRYLNLFLTMLLGGLWHGAGWTFVFWGALHGLYLIVNNLWRKAIGHDPSRPVHPVVHVLCVAVTFLCVLLAWVPFRAASMEVTWAFYQAMFGLNASWTGLPAWDFMAWMVVASAVVWGLPNAQQFLAGYRPAWDSVKVSGTLLWRPTALHGAWLGVLFGVALVAVSGVGEFLYFQF